MIIPVFLIIESNKDSYKHYIKPIDILNIVDRIYYREVRYRENTEVKSIETLLTGEDIQEAMQEIERQLDKQFLVN